MPGVGGDNEALTADGNDTSGANGGAAEIGVGGDSADRSASGNGTNSMTPGEGAGNGAGGRADNMTPRKGAKAARKVGLIVIAVILVYVLINALAMPMFFGEFRRRATYVCPIPDLWSGFIPQGVTRAAGDDLCMICGYRTDDGPSCIYRLGLDGNTTMIMLAYEDGEIYSGHAGGMSAFGEYVYISNASKIFVLDANEVAAAQDGDTVRFIGRFEVPCRASFCSCDGGLLYVGEYHADGYITDESHKVGNAESIYQAMVFGYKVDAEAPLGIANTEIPAVAYSVPDFVQGFAVSSSGLAALSCSSGLKDSKLRFYDASTEADASFFIGDAEIPLYILDRHRQKGVLTMPHMSEDLEYINEKFYLPFEAGALKFGGGLIPTSVSSVVAIKP